ncbi:MAG TPA: hypothetical protein VF333_09980 [Pyrinomonadaceae bacterium]
MHRQKFSSLSMKHVHPDAFVDEFSVNRQTVVDDLEPQLKMADAVREARVEAVRLINSFASLIESALTRPRSTMRDLLTVFYQGAYAMDLNLCEDVNVTERADNIGVRRATLSKGMVAFCVGNSLPPSRHMKDKETQAEYLKARLERVTRGCNKPKA